MLARTVIVLFVLLPVIAGWIAMFGSRMIDAENLLQLGRVHVLHVERLDHLLVVLQVVLLIVREDEDRLLVEDLVREPVHRHDLVERLLQRDIVELQGDRAIHHVAVVGHVDAGQIGDEVEHVLERRVVERQREARGRTEHRLGGRGARPFAQLLAGGAGPRRFGAIAQGLVDRRHLDREPAVGRVVLARQLVLAERRFELILLLERARPILMQTRRRLHRPLERDLVAWIVGVGLDGAPIRGDGLIEIARLGGFVALAERLPGRTTAREQGKRQQDTDSPQPIGQSELLRSKRSPALVAASPWLNACPAA